RGVHHVSGLAVVVRQLAVDAVDEVVGVAEREAEEVERGIRQLRHVGEGQIGGRRPAQRALRVRREGGDHAEEERAWSTRVERREKCGAGRHRERRAWQYPLEVVVEDDAAVADVLELRQRAAYRTAQG